MLFSKALMRGLLVAAVVTSAVAAQALTIDLVPVGDAGNLPDTRYHSTGFGAVPRNYQIGKYEVTAGQYRDFLNAVAATDTYSLYNPSMDSDSWGCQITQHGTSGTYTYDFSGRPNGTESDWINRPVNYVSWGDAARFSNWLQNGQPTGQQGTATTETGAYTLNGATSYSALMAIIRNGTATWFIPTEDEWYKAAYYDPAKPGGAGYWDYPTKSYVPPINTLLTPDPGNHANFYDWYGTGNHGYTIGTPYYRTNVGEFENSASAYGTFDQGGNVWEWHETNVNYGYRGFLGGSFYYYSGDLAASSGGIFGLPSVEGRYYGFRVASVPEPGSITLLVSGAIAGLICWRRWR